MGSSECFVRPTVAQIQEAPDKAYFLESPIFTKYASALWLNNEAKKKK